MGLSLNNLAVTATSNAMTSAMGAMFNTLQSKIANGGRDTNCKFYYNNGAGGSILQVAAKAVVGGVVSELKDEAVNAFNSLLDKKKDEEPIANNWINNGRKKREEEGNKYGRMIVDEDYAVVALDDWGIPSPDALMLGIKTDKEIKYSQTYYEYSAEKVENADKRYGKYSYKETKPKPVPNNFTSKTLVWYDTTAMITINSDKNIVISRVQGRDYSRKELVSNGDIKFSVSGQITGRIPDVYPTEEVAKFLKVMQYKGIVRVNNQILDQFNISDIVITDFNLTPKSGYKSVQYYSFLAIGLQPEFEEAITSDTIEFEEIKSIENKEDDKNEWMKMLKNKRDGLKSMAKDVFSQGVGLAAGMLENKL